nr:MAG TPA: hypothetical protein [Caudoviricetes sp.]
MVVLYGVDCKCFFSLCAVFLNAHLLMKELQIVAY